MASTQFRVLCDSQALPNADEALLDTLGDQPQALVWRTEQCLVAPRSYANNPVFNQLLETPGALSCPVYTRRSGGGVVPQCPGVVNLSLLMPLPEGPGIWMTRVYDYLAQILAQVFKSYGLDAQTGAVAGSFCDGKYNLAIMRKKICGTAQYWRKVRGQHCVLAQALVLVNLDLAAATARCNALEQKIGSGRQYEVGATCHLADFVDLSPAQFSEDLKTALCLCTPLSIR